MGYVPKSKDPFVFHHLAVCEDGEFNMKAAGYLPEEVENLLPVGAKYNLLPILVTTTDIYCFLFPSRKK